MSSLRLWWGSGSPYAWKVLVYLNEKNVPFQSNLVQFSKQEHKTTEFLKLNPRGKVPVLEDGSIVVYESMAILHYLENKYKETGNWHALGKDLATQAKILTRTYEVENYLTSPGFAFFRYLWGRDNDWETAVKNYEQMTEELHKWEAYLQEGPYFAGQEFSLVDCVIAPFLYTASDRVGFDFKKHGFTKIAEYVENNRNRPSIAKSVPPHWKETPATNTFKFFEEKYKNRHKE